jgi:hypothetical protein
VLSTERNPGGLVLVAEHPASAGLVLETGTFDRDLAERHIAWWMRQREFAVADAAPELVHPEAVAGVRTLVQAFEWPTVQVRAVAFLLFEVDVLTADEAGWIAGFVASVVDVEVDEPAPVPADGLDVGTVDRVGECPAMADDRLRDSKGVTWCGVRRRRHALRGGIEQTAQLDRGQVKHVGQALA